MRRPEVGGGAISVQESWRVEKEERRETLRYKLGDGETIHDAVTRAQLMASQNPSAGYVIVSRCCDLAIDEHSNRPCRTL